MKKAVITGCLLCMIMHVAAQPSFLFRNISINEGLSQSSVMSIAADSTGFLWFATQDGLNRYDGKEFLIFKKNFDDITTHTGSRLGKIVADGSERLWLITSNGRLEQFNLYNHSFRSINKLTKDSFALPRLSCLLHDRKGNLWMGTENEGIIAYDPGAGKITRYTSRPAPSSLSIVNDSINYLYEDSRENIWILTHDGITVFKNKSTPVDMSLNLKKRRGISFSAITEDADGNLWAGSYGKGLFLKKKEDSVFRAFPRVSENLVIESVLADRSGKLWIGTYGKGLFIYHIKDSTVQHFLNEEANTYSIGFNDILSICQDRQGGIWLGTDGGGVSYYNERLNNFALLSNHNLAKNISISPIRSITTDRYGAIWAGTSSSGFSRIDLKSNEHTTFHIKPFNSKISNPERVVSLFTDDNNDIWVGTQGNGLLILDNKSRKYKHWYHPFAPGKSNIPDGTIWCMLHDSAGRVWAGTQSSGLCLIDKDKGLLKKMDAGSNMFNTVLENNIRALANVNDSVLAIGYEEKGIQLFNFSKQVFLHDADKISEQFRNSGINVKSLYCQYPVLWIGTRGKGLVAYNLLSKQSTFITEEQGLPNNTIYGILKDGGNSLWLSSNRGICQFSPPANLQSVNKSHFNVFTMTDGLQSNEFNTGAYFRSPEGILHFGGMKGLNFFNPDKIIGNNEPVRIAITDITIDNGPLTNDSNITYKKTLRLSYRPRSIGFKFAALDFVSSGRYDYYYQMDGYDKQWIDAGNRNYINYTNLPPGKYTFRIKAGIPGAKQESRATTLSIIIPPPFWKTWWFIALSVLAVALALYSLYRYRINQLVKLHAVRDRIATDLHDDIGSTLSNINMLSVITQKKLDKPEEASQHLKRISEEVSSCSQALDDIIWSANSKNDTLEETIARMRRYAAELFENTGHITCHLDMDEQFTIHKLRMEQRRDIYLIYKEALNNIYKHASASTAWIMVKVKNNTLQLVFRDNGKGFDVDRATHRNGLKNMRARVKKWKGNLSIHSEKQKGTELQISLPIDRPNE